MVLGGILAWLTALPGVPTIELDDQRLMRLRQAYVAEYNAPPTAQAWLALLNREINEEILFQEALKEGYGKLPAVQLRLQALGAHLELGDSPSTQGRRLDRLGLLQRDPVIRRYLVNVKRSQLLNQLPIPEAEREQLVSFYESHREEYLLAAQHRVSHLFIAGQGSDVEQKIADMADRLHRVPTDRARLAARLDQEIAMGEAFPGGHHFPWMTFQQLSARMGDDFALAVESLPQGEWSLPVQSSYGWHLIWKHDQHEAAQPELDQVEARVREHWRLVQKDRVLSEQLAKLRKKYGVTGNVMTSGHLAMFKGPEVP